MASSKLSAEDRLLRKRQAARLRQQRCRARKRQAIQLKQMQDKVRVKPSTATAVMAVTAASSNENQHPNNKHRIKFDVNPRSMYWQKGRRFVLPPSATAQRFSSFDSERSYSSYESPVEARYDSNSVEYHPVYSRYQPSPSQSPRAPPPRYVQQPMVRRYPLPPPPQAREQPPPPYYSRPKQFAPQRFAPVARPPPPPPKEATASLRDDAVLKKEVAAIDALFSLKKAGDLVESRSFLYAKV